MLNIEASRCRMQRAVKDAMVKSNCLAQLYCTQNCQSIYVQWTAYRLCYCWQGSSERSSSRSRRMPSTKGCHRGIMAV